MVCKKCGKEVPDASKFCPYCGAAMGKVEDAASGADAKESESSAVASEAEAVQNGAEAKADAAEAAGVVAAAATSGAEATVAPTDTTTSESSAAISEADKLPGPTIVAPEQDGQPLQSGQDQIQQTDPQVQQNQLNQQPYGQPFAANQPYGAIPAPVGPGFAPPIPIKKHSRVPFIIIGVIILLALAGGATALAMNIFGTKPMGEAVYDAVFETLSYETEKLDMEIYMEYDGETMPIGIKWNLGKDLKSSTIWVDVTVPRSGTNGFVLKDDIVRVYQKTGTKITVTAEETDVVNLMNEAFYDEYGVKIDANKFVKNNKFDQQYLEEVSKLLSEENTELLPGYDDIDYEKVWTIFGDFMTKEMSKKSVYEKFMEVESSKSGGVTTYESSIEIVGMIEALGEYAEARGGKDKNYSDAAEFISDACDQVTSIAGGINIEVDVVAKVKGKMLQELTMSFSYGGEEIKAGLIVNSIDIDLSKDSELKEIMSAKVSSSSSRGLGLNF